ncbi:AT-rich interactive domain-containing protein 4A isoform X2 [Periophthalmus magnuspinnatus]|uniref:AT-rich interactive domain-containing protein 4A isoform X2 n=1 Tax=Periophthalmus magnuspinnatus TaxID=409849 RepID=UPI0024370DBB|nr:AT-rich interactive domain-containing protein 4A isoform X2 [Periophthalmus magnuspinnatus]
MKAVEEPAYLTVGTDVSAKYRGAFCEAKIKTVKRLVKVKVTLKGEGTSQVVHDDQVKGQLRVGSVVEVKTNEGGNSEAVISKLTDASLYTVVFDDGDEKTLRRTSLCLKGERHFAESETLDQLPLTNPEHFGTPVIGKKSNRGRRSSQAVPDEENESSSSEEEEEESRVSDELLGTVCSVEGPEPGLVLVLSPVCNEELVVKKDHCLVRSFGDGKFSTVLRRHLHTLNSASICKPELANRQGVSAAQAFLRTRAVPEVWKMDLSQILESSSDSDDKHSDEDQEEQERRKKRLEEEPEEEPDPEERDHFLQQLYKFMEDRGTPINKPPVLGYKGLNLFKLFRLVTLQGGCSGIESGTVWKQIYMDLGIPVLNSAAAYNVKTAYKKYLFGFEEFCRSALITFRTIHHNNPCPPPSPTNQRAASETKTSPPSNHTALPEPKSNPVPNQRTAGAELKDTVKTETDSESDSDHEERHTSPRGRRRCVLPLKDKRGTDSDEQREPRKRTPRQTDQSERTPRLTDQSESGGRLSDQSERGSDDEEDDDDEEEEDELPHQPTERSEEDPDGVTGTRVRVKYGRGKTQKIYEAHIKKTDVDNGENFYLVHYYGWNVRYDEWVKADRIIWPSEKGSKKKRRGKLKNKEEGPPEEERPPPMRTSGARRGRPLGSKNKTNGRAPETRPDSGPNMSNGDNTPRRRTRRTSGMFDSDRASNEDSGNSSDDSESEDSTEKKQFPWRRKEAGPKQEAELCLKQEEEEPSCEDTPDTVPKPTDTTAPSMHQDTAHSQSVQGAGQEQLPVTPEKALAPPTLLLDSSPRLKLLPSVPLMPLPPLSEPMVVLHHCLPPDSDTDSASESDSEKEEKRRGRRGELRGERTEVKEEVTEEVREEMVRSPAKLLNNKSPLRDWNLNARSPQKERCIGDRSPLRATVRSPARDKKEAERNQEDRTQGERTQGERTQGERTQGERTQGDRTQGERTQGDRTQEDKNQGDRTQEDKNQGERTQEDKNQGERTQEDKTQGERTQEDKNQGERTQEDKDQGERTQEDKNLGERTQEDKNLGERTQENKNLGERTQEDKNLGEGTLRSEKTEDASSPLRPIKTKGEIPDKIQLEKAALRLDKPQGDQGPPKGPPQGPLQEGADCPNEERCQVERTPEKRDRTASEKPPEQEEKEEGTDNIESEKTTVKRKAPEQKSPEKKLKTETQTSPKTTNMADTEQQSGARQEEVKMEVREAKGDDEEPEQREPTLPEMGPEALVCYEVDLDEPDEREKAVSASEQLLLMMRESHLHLSPPVPHKVPPTPSKGLSTLPKAPSTVPEHNCTERREERGNTGGNEQGRQRGNEDTNSSSTSNSSHCDRGQKRVLEGPSPTVKKHKRHKRPTPQKHDKNGAGHSSDSEDQTHKHCPSPTSRGHKWTLHIDDLEKMSSSERISFLQDKLQEIRKYYLSLKSEVASIDRRRKRLKKKEREVSNTASTSSSSDAALSPSSSSPSQSSLAVEVR